MNKIAVIKVKEGNHLYLKGFSGGFVCTDGRIGPDENAKAEFYGEKAETKLQNFADEHGLKIVEK
jgi:hypothetical protein